MRVVLTVAIIRAQGTCKVIRNPMETTMPTELTSRLDAWWGAFRAAAADRAAECDAPPIVLAEFLYVAGVGDPFGDDISILSMSPQRTARTFFDSWAHHDWETYEDASIWTWQGGDTGAGDEVDFVAETDSGLWLLEDAEGSTYELDLDGTTWRHVAGGGDDANRAVRYVDHVAAWPAVGRTACIVFEGARGPRWFYESGVVTRISRGPQA